MLHKLKFIALIVLAAVSLNCNGSKNKAKTPKDVILNKTQTLDFKTLLSSSHTNVTEATQQVITAQSELDALYEIINSTKSPNDPVPTVDFTTQEVFFYTPGQVSHGVPGIEVASVTKSKDKLVVQIKGHKQNPSGYVTTVLSQPGVIIEYPKVNLPVVVKMPKEH